MDLCALELEKPDVTEWYEGKASRFGLGDTLKAARELDNTIPKSVECFSPLAITFLLYLT
jgi:hypothetical protein